MPAALALLGCLSAPPAAADAPPDPPAAPRLFAVESFDAVTPGAPILGTDGGEGWAGPWVERPFAFANQPDPANHPPRADALLGMADSLPHGDPAVRAAARGGSASAVALRPGEGVSLLSRPLKDQIGLPGQTVYVGVLLKPEGRLHDGAFLGAFGVMLRLNMPDAAALARLPRRQFEKTNAPGDPGGLIFGKAYDSQTFDPNVRPLRTSPADRSEVWQLFGLAAAPWRVERAGGRAVPPRHALGGGPYQGMNPSGHHIATDVPVVAGKTTLLVCGTEFDPPGGRGARFALWADPDPREPGPPQASGYIGEGRRWDRSRPTGETTWVTLMSTGAVTVDELRIADTFRGAAGLPADD